ncbi:MAG: 23S rRNA (uracil(1939)-C(5))-methyltransferase RlmD [Rhodanobacteraceae bacterium]
MRPSSTTSPVYAEVTDLSHDGRGVARIDGKAVFVTGALPGERARVRLARRHRSFDEAIVEELLRVSPDRVEPVCAHFGTCAGCVLQHLSSGAQVAAKQRILRENFERIGKIEPESWLAPLTGQPWGYRRKGRLSVKWVAKKDRIVVGFRETNARFVADLASCHTLLPAVGRRIEALAGMIGTLEAKRAIAQIEIAAGDESVALVFRHLSPLSEVDRATLAAFGRSHDLAILLQPGGPDSVQPLWPPTAPVLSFRVEDIEFRFQPLDFVQVNAGMNRRMIARVLELLDPQPDDRVLDLFCGLGNFSLPIARRVAAVTGVEGDAGLVARARENADRNGIRNVEFVAADLGVEQRAARFAQPAASDKMLLDPPRSGAATLLDYLPHEAIRRVVYVSCHPGSLARDAATLVKRHGFRLAAAGIMDMFAHTAHVESIALFERD